MHAWVGEGRVIGCARCRTRSGEAWAGGGAAEDAKGLCGNLPGGCGRRWRWPR